MTCSFLFHPPRLLSSIVLFTLFSNEYKFLPFVSCSQYCCHLFPSTQYFSPQPWKDLYLYQYLPFSLLFSQFVHLFISLNAYVYWNPHWWYPNAPHCSFPDGKQNLIDQVLLTSRWTNLYTFYSWYWITAHHHLMILDLCSLYYHQYTIQFNCKNIHLSPHSKPGLQRLLL